MSNIPPSLKKIEPYVKRAQDFNASEPLIAYYCRLYALQQALTLRDPSNPQAQTYVMELFQTCERQKSSLAPNSDTHGSDFRSFTYEMFQSTVETYRNGLASQALAVDFLRTSHLIDVCSFFRPLDEELLLMRKRCKGWAVNIVRDVKEGRQPLPPPELVKSPGQTDGPHNLEHSEYANAVPSITSIDTKAATAAPIPPQPHLGDTYNIQSQPTNWTHQEDHVPTYDNHALAAVASRPIPPPPPIEEYNVAATTFVDPPPEHPSSGNSWNPPMQSSPPVSSDYRLSDGQALAATPTAHHDPLTHEAGNFSSAPYTAISSSVTHGIVASSGPSSGRTTEQHPSAALPMLPVGRTTVSDVSFVPAAKPAVAAARTAQVPVVSLSTAVQPVSVQLSHQEISLAQKKAKFAVSALDFSDVKTAIKELEESLAILTGRTG